MNTAMKIELVPEQSFFARAGEQIVRGLSVVGEWEGLRKVVDGRGRSLIVDQDGIVLKGTDGLLHDLRLTTGHDDFVTVQKTELPDGTVVPAFRVGRYACSKNADGKAAVSKDGKPWTNINFASAKEACAAAGFELITELQCLAIAHQIWHQDVNWSGGKVGEGKLYQGLHKGTVAGPQDGNYESPHADERRWHELTNGERVYDFAGNVWTWVFDNVQGNDQGIVSKSIGKDSPSRSTIPEDCYAKGGGYVYDSTTLNWSGRALIRGGRWRSGSAAGVFRLDRVWPVDEYGYVGFRCTK
jgi:hypothetical protein